MAAWSRIKRGKPCLTEQDVRTIVQDEVRRSVKVGCKNFCMRDGRGYCRNCGYHYDEH